jgi:hypothetical protein
MRIKRYLCFLALAGGLLTATGDLYAQTPGSNNGLSLFSNHDSVASGGRVFNGVFGRYGVTFAAGDATPRFRGPGADIKFEQNLSDGGQDSDGLSLIGAYTVNQFRVAVDIRRDRLDFERRRSSTELGVGFVSMVKDGLTIGGGPTIGFGDVTPSRSPLRTASDGTLGLNGAATLSLSENWALTGVLGYRARASGAKEESFFSLFGFDYRF